MCKSHNLKQIFFRCARCDAPADVAGGAAAAHVGLALGRVHGDRLVGEQGEGVLYHQPDQPLRVEDELVARCVAVADVGVQPLDLRRARQDLQRVCRGHGQGGMVGTVDNRV